MCLNKVLIWYRNQRRLCSNQFMLSLKRLVFHLNILFFIVVHFRRQKYAELKSIQERRKDQSQREDWLETTKVGSDRRNRWTTSSRVNNPNKFTKYCQKWKFLWFEDWSAVVVGKPAGSSSIRGPWCMLLWTKGVGHGVSSRHCRSPVLCMGNLWQCVAVWQRGFDWGAIPTTRRQVGHMAAQAKLLCNSNLSGRPMSSRKWLIFNGQCPVGNG